MAPSLGYTDVDTVELISLDGGVRGCVAWRHEIR